MSAGAVSHQPWRLVRFLVGLVEEFGACGTLAVASCAACFRGRAGAAPIGASVVRELAWMFAGGMPAVGFLSIGLGSFLSMQAFYGATFAEGTGAVVGVGLVRNAAPLVTGLLLAGLLGSRVVYELRKRDRNSADPARFAAPRLVASMIAGPILAFWGALVGTLVGWQVGQTMLGVSTPTFFLRFWDMLWTIDVVGLVVKGAAFGLASGLFACVEGLKDAGRDWPAIQRAALRAICFASAMVLFLNSTWFLIVYVGGTPFSPVAD